MTCKDCIHCEICPNKRKHHIVKNGFLFYFQCIDIENICSTFKDKSKYIELPCIAMIEQHLVGGKFVNSSLQNWNGKYAVAYFDKKKSNILLIDICGKYPYNADEAQKRLKELQ